MSVAGHPYHLLKVAAIREEIPGFKTFHFENGHGISWQPGQYLTLVKQIAGEEIRRSYSITTSPFLNEELSIGVKRMENGLLSRWLVDSVAVGNELATIGAGGFFTLPAEMINYQQIFFFAAGSGITPVYPLIKTILHQYPAVEVVLVYSNASIEKTVFLSELIQLEQQCSERFKTEFLFSNHPDLRRARLNRDLLLELVRQHSCHPLSQTLFYTCGPESYMRLCTYVLQETGVPKENIRKENFITHKITAPVYPPDQRKHKASISYAGTDYVIDVHYPDSILKAAKKQGINLPYSCEAGQCGNCVAICTKGKLWHSNNEVLTDRDLENGLVLTCVGHPVGGDVFLEIK